MLKKYDKEKLYLCACSSGPDSMALLDMLIKNDFKIIVVHVNYKTRKESDDEERLVREYCLKNNIECYVETFNNDFKGNFEDVARKFRYDFFSKVYKKVLASGIFVAHHKDDVIETYLLKKQRNTINESYLINEISFINDMKVIRPLIYDFYKEDLLKYCHTNNIEYGIDKTNFMDIHTRNIIRKNIENMDKEKLYQKALEDEDKLIKIRKEVKEFIKYYPLFTCDLLKHKNDMWLSIFLYESCVKKYRRFINKSILLALKDFFKSDKPNLNKYVADDYYLIKSYNEIKYGYLKEQDYCYVLDKIEYISTPHFKIVNEGLKMHGIYVEESDFPITIRNAKETDVIKLKEGTKKVSRLFIDKKVPVNERKMLPVIENCNKQIIFVYNLYRKYGLKYVKNNLFMIK